MVRAKQLERYVGDAIEYDLLKLEEDPHYITVYYKNVLSGEGAEWRWSFVCMIDKNSTVIQAVNRLNLILADELRSSRQDVNIMYKEWQPKGRR